jgi:tetratricopeptide (TPR) repeat protein
MVEAMKEKIPDPKAMEKMTSDLSRMLQEQDFQSEDELKAYLDSMVKGKKISKAPPKSAVQFAQDIMYEAWEAKSRKERIKLAKEALSISQDCADAYNLLAEEDAKTLEEAKELYQKGVDAGRRALGEKIFQEDGGHFWGYTPTRPYMRSRAGLMECLWEIGEHDEAIAHAKEMLKLNKNDNQGVRYILIAYLAELGRFDELDKFMNKNYKNDCAAEWLYTRALSAFVRGKDFSEAERELKIALKANRHVPEYLTGKKAIPRVLPDRITVGGEDEGFCYAARNLEAWKKVPGAINWLKEQVGIRVTPKVGRNELCPCGSGKKYKKCCGA